METPSQLLAAKIVERLIAEKLLFPDPNGKLQAKLAEGLLKSEDWRLSVEITDAKRVKS